MQIRLDRYLTEMSLGSRSEVKDHIRRGRIRIDGTIVKKPEYKVDTDKNTVSFLEERIPYYEKEYFLLYKTAGYITATKDPKQPTVMELLPKIRRSDDAPVGRLDKDTEGLLLITNDGKTAFQLLSPGKHVPKTYEAHLSGPLSEEMRLQLEEGVDIGDETITAPARCRILSEDRCRASLTITEGRYHQVKRMFQAVGPEVVYLKRLTMGNLTLSDLEPGGCRRLTEQEITSLLCSERKDGSI